MHLSKDAFVVGGSKLALREVLEGAAQVLDRQAANLGKVAILIVHSADAQELARTCLLPSLRLFQHNVTELIAVLTAGLDS